MKPFTKRLFSPVALILSASVLWTVPSRAQILVEANFSGGNGTSSVDQFQGTAGGGWANAWGFTGVDYSASVVSGDPMDGDYLSITRPSTATTTASLTRTIDNGVLDTAANHVVSFSLRLDALPSAQTLSIGGYSLGATSAWNWLIIGDSARWAFYNGLTIVNVTGVTPQAGHTYDFTVNVNMVDKQWTASVQDGGSSYTSGVLGFRNTVAVNDQRLLFSVANGSAQALDLSIDSVSYSAVPEPNVTALLIGGLVVLVGSGKSRQMRQSQGETRRHGV